MTPFSTHKNKPMNITLAFNAATEDEECYGERLESEYVQLLSDTINSLGHNVECLEMSRPGDQIVDDLVALSPDLVFNMAEGTSPTKRESYYPSIYEMLGLAYTGSSPFLLRVGIEKRLTEKIFAIRGVNVPRGAALTRRNNQIPSHLCYPVFVKPNAEGSSLGISRENIAEDPQQAKEISSRLLEQYPDGVEVEEFIKGREIQVGMLEGCPQKILEPVEYEVKIDEHNIMDRRIKGSTDPEHIVQTHCPAPLDDQERQTVLQTATAAFQVMQTKDFGRIDLRLDEDGQAYAIEINPLPGLRRKSPLVTAAKAIGLSYQKIIASIIHSATDRYGLNRSTDESYRERPKQTSTNDQTDSEEKKTTHD